MFGMMWQRMKTRKKCGGCSVAGVSRRQVRHRAVDLTRVKKEDAGVNLMAESHPV